MVATERAATIAGKQKPGTNRLVWAACALLAAVVLGEVGPLALRWMKAYRVAKYHGKGADLRGALLLWAPLRGADLEKANLQRANLGGGNLAHAQWEYEANWRSASFTGANLQDVWFGGQCEMSGADLAEVFLALGQSANNR